MKEGKQDIKAKGTGKGTCCHSVMETLLLLFAASGNASQDQP